MTDRPITCRRLLVFACRSDLAWLLLRLRSPSWPSISESAVRAVLSAPVLLLIAHP